jgi:hypothetical protein
MLDRENFVARLRVVAGLLAKAGPNDPVPNALGLALAAEIHTVEFHRRYVLLVDLAERARDQAATLSDPNAQLYVDAIRAMLSAVSSLDMRENWGRYSGPFGTRAMTLLELCERAVAHHLTVAEPPEDQVFALLTPIQEAISAVVASDFEPEAKQLLLEMLRDVEKALLAYHVSGLAGLRVALERTVGAVVLHQTMLAPYREKPAYKQAASALGKTLTFLRNVEFLRQLPEKVDDLIRYFSGA